MFDSLPIIIVTAKSKTAADNLISEIIDDDVTAETKPAGHESRDRVWRLVNKYYTALVRLHARAADEPARLHAGPVGAHVALLAPDELGVGAVAAAERRLAPRAWLGVGAAPVNVLACEAAGVPDALLELCARRRLEPVALREAEDGGLPAVRAALHAHTWPGLRRTPAAEEAPAWLPEERCARAMRALGAAAARAAPLQGSERRAAAERLVLAFAAAIGFPLTEEELGEESDAPADRIEDA